MSKREKKEILEGCAVDTFCDGTCRTNHRRNYDPVKKKPYNALLTTGTTWKRLGQNRVVVVEEESQRRESHGKG